MDTNYAEQLFIEQMQSFDECNHTLLCELKYLASQENKTPERILWIVEARVEQNVRETSSRLARALEEACIPVQ
jgi:hypothetical protein